MNDTQNPTNQQSENTSGILHHRELHKAAHRLFVSPIGEHIREVGRRVHGVELNGAQVLAVIARISDGMIGDLSFGALDHDATLSVGIVAELGVRL